MRQLHKICQLAERIRNTENVPNPEIPLAMLDKAIGVYNELLEKIRTDPDNLKTWEKLLEPTLSLQKCFEECEQLVAAVEQSNSFGLFDGTDYED